MNNLSVILFLMRFDVKCSVNPMALAIEQIITGIAHLVPHYCTRLEDRSIILSLNKATRCYFRILLIASNFLIRIISNWSVFNPFCKPTCMKALSDNSSLPVKQELARYSSYHLNFRSPLYLTDRLPDHQTCH